MASRKLIGSVEKGKLADLVLWSQALSSASNPNASSRGGSIVGRAPMGDPQRAIPTPQPVHYQPMFAAFGKIADGILRGVFLEAAVVSGLAKKLGIDKKLYRSKIPVAASPRRA